MVISVTFPEEPAFVPPGGGAPLPASAGRELLPRPADSTRIPFDQRPREWKNGYAAGYHARVNRPPRIVRWSEDGPEMQCPTCAERGGVTSFWPITDAFWNPRSLARCRACNGALKRQKAKAMYWADPETQRRLKAVYYRANQRVIVLKKRVYHDEHQDHDNARSKAYRDAHRDAIRAYRRAYYAKHRDRILFREKLRRAGVAA